MADRATVEALIDANLPDNTTEQITPEKHREVEKSLNNNSFNKDSDEATDVNYTPTNSADWLPEGDPSEVGEGLDVLAARTGVNLSQDIAYVSNVTTAGITPELGNPLKPFATFLAALNALPSSNCTVKVLGGTYTENLTIVKDNFVLDAQGIVLNGAVTFNGDSIIMNFKGSNINSSILGYGIRQVSLTNKYCQIIGGVWTESNATNSEAFRNLNNTTIKGSLILNSGYCIQGCDNCVFENVITDGGSGIRRSANNVFNNCTIEATAGFSDGAAYTSPNSASNKFINCHLISATPLIGESTLGVNGEFINTKIENVGTGNAITVSGNTFLLTFTNNCILIGQSNCIEFTTVTRPTNTDVLFKDCILYAGTGEIIKEPTYLVTDLGETLCINNTFNKTQITSVKVTEQNTYVNTNLQQF